MNGAVEGCNCTNGDATTQSMSTALLYTISEFKYFLFVAYLSIRVKLGAENGEYSTDCTGRVRELTIEMSCS